MEASLPAGELELAGHDEHVQLLLLDRYFPAPQSLHDGAAWTWYVQSAEVLTVPWPDACAMRSVTVPEEGAVYEFVAVEDRCMLHDPEMMP